MQNNTIRDPLGQNNIMKFGSDRVDKFLKANGISTIIRSHQNCIGGFDRQFAQGQFITVSSCTDYANKYGNDAAFIVIQKKIVISAKVIKPTQQSKLNWIESGPIPESANSSVKRPISPLRITKQVPE